MLGVAHDYTDERKKLISRPRCLSSVWSSLSSSLSSRRRIGSKRLRATRLKGGRRLAAAGSRAVRGWRWARWYRHSGRVSTESVDYEFGQNLSRRVIYRPPALLRRAAVAISCFPPPAKMYLRNWLWWLCKRSRRHVCRLHSDTDAPRVYSFFPPFRRRTRVGVRVLSDRCISDFNPPPSYLGRRASRLRRHYDNVRSDGHGCAPPVVCLSRPTARGTGGGRRFIFAQ